MPEPAKRFEDAPVALLEGEIALSTEQQFVVRTEGGDYRARQAASCLLVPELSDRVLVCVGPRDCFILAILERRAAARARLEFAGDLEICVRQGSFRVNAQHGLSLAASQEVSVAAKGVRICAGEANVVLRRIRIFADSCESIVTRLLQRLRISQRVVEELDQVRAGQIDIVAEQELRLRSQNTLVQAAALVKVDGGQIHLG